MAARGFPYTDLKDFLAALERGGRAAPGRRPGRPDPGDQRDRHPHGPGRRPGAAVRASDPGRDAGGDQPVRHRPADGDGARRRRRSTRSATGSASCSSRSCRSAGRASGRASASCCSSSRVPPKKVKTRALPGGRLPGRRRRPRPAARAAGLARRRRHLPQLRADPHQAPGDRQAQPRPLPPAAARAAPRSGMHWQIHKDSTAHHAVAERLGRAAAGRDRVRLRPGRHVRGHARRCPATSTSTCSPASCAASGSRWSTA